MDTIATLEAELDALMGAANTLRGKLREAHRERIETELIDHLRALEFHVNCGANNCNLVVAPGDHPDQREPLDSLRELFGWDRYSRVTHNHRDLRITFDNGCLFVSTTSMDGLPGLVGRYGIRVVDTSDFDKTIDRMNRAMRESRKQIRAFEVIRDGIQAAMRNG